MLIHQSVLKHTPLVLALLVVASYLTHAWFTARSDNNIKGVKQLTTNNDASARARNLYYNLLETVEDLASTDENCNQEYVNTKQLQQDHPCVIELIRRKYLHGPSPPEVPLHLEYPDTIDPSTGQSSVILSYLGNKTGGFFVECGADDGESLSNTLYMEKNLGWRGVLIEAKLKSFQKLLTRNRKAHTLPVCLSQRPYPTEVSFVEEESLGRIYSQHTWNSNVMEKEGIVRRQCFPLYSILLAVGRVQVDYFSVDVEGSEAQILETIPWHKVDIKTLTVEVTSRNASKVHGLTQFMKRQGYESLGLMSGRSFHDLVFVQKYKT